MLLNLVEFLPPTLILILNNLQGGCRHDFAPPHTSPAIFHCILGCKKKRPTQHETNLLHLFERLSRRGKEQDAKECSKRRAFSAVQRLLLSHFHFSHEPISSIVLGKLRTREQKALRPLQADSQQAKAPSPHSPKHARNCFPDIA